MPQSIIVRTGANFNFKGGNGENINIYRRDKVESRNIELKRADLMSEADALRGHINYYMNNHEKIFVQAYYQTQSEYHLKESPKGVTFNFPFCVIAPDNERYPINRSYKVIIFYPAVTTHFNNEPVLYPGEKSTDFITITIDYTKGRFEEAKEHAISFITTKISEVLENYQSDPNL